MSWRHHPSLIPSKLREPQKQTKLGCQTLKFLIKIPNWDTFSWLLIEIPYHNSTLIPCGFLIKMPIRLNFENPSRLMVFIQNSLLRFPMKIPYLNPVSKSLSRFQIKILYQYSLLIILIDIPSQDSLSRFLITIPYWHSLWRLFVNFPYWDSFKTPYWYSLSRFWIKITYH